MLPFKSWYTQKNILGVVFGSYLQNTSLIFLIAGKEKNEIVVYHFLINKSLHNLYIVEFRIVIYVIV